jgi:hypothetical protein
MRSIPVVCLPAPQSKNNIEQIYLNLLRQSLNCEQRAVSDLFDIILKKAFDLDQMLMIAATRALQASSILEQYKAVFDVQHPDCGSCVQLLNHSHEILRATADTSNSEKPREAFLHFAELMNQLEKSVVIISDTPTHEDNELMIRYLKNFISCTECLTQLAFREVGTPSACLKSDR